MTCKLLHHYIRKSGGYIDGADFAALVKAQKLDLIVFDFCAMFFFLLRSERFGVNLLLDKLGMYFHNLVYSNAIATTHQFEPQ